MTRRRGVPRQAYRAARAARVGSQSRRRRHWDLQHAEACRAQAARVPMEARLLLARSELCDFLLSGTGGDLVLALELLASCCPSTGSVCQLDYGQLTG